MKPICVIAVLVCGTCTAAEFINGPVVRKVVVNAAPIVDRAEWTVTGLGVFRCFINGREVGAENVLKPGYTDVKKHRDAFTYDVNEFLNKGVGETNVFSAIVTDGWWSDKLMGKNAGKHCAFWATGIVATDASWECSTRTPVRAGIWEGEKFDARIEPGDWQAATVNREFKGEVVPVIDGKVRSRAPLKVVKSWTTEGKTVYDFGQNCAAVPRFTLRGECGAVFRYRLGEMLNDGVKHHRGDGPKDTVYLANLRGAAEDLSYTLKGGAAEVYMPQYTFYGYRYLQVDATQNVEIVSVESVPLSSVSEDLDRGTLAAGDSALDRLIRNARWGMLSNYLSIPTDCPQRSERLGWTGDTQVFAKTAGYFADTRDFFRKWMRDLRDAQADNGCFPDVAPRAAFGEKGGQAAWSDAGIVVPYRVWKQTGDERIVRENWDAMRKFVDFMDKTDYTMRRGNWLLCDWLSYEKLSVDQRKRWSNGTITDDHLSYQNYLNACYMVSDLMMMRELAEKIEGLSSPEDHFAALENRTRDRIRATWFTSDGALIPLFDTMQTPRLMSLKIGVGDVKRLGRELVELVKGNGHRIATGFVGTSELTDQLAAIGAYETVWSVILNHDFPSWLYSVDNGATTIWERWDGYTKEKGFGDVGMNSFNHYAYGSVVGWLFEHGVGIQPGANGGYKRFVLAPHPDQRVGSLKGTYKSEYGTIVSGWSYDGDVCTWTFTIPEGTTAELRLPNGTTETLKAGVYTRVIR